MARSECLQNFERDVFLQTWLVADSILNAVQKSPGADVCRNDTESCAAPVQACRASHTDGCYPLPPKNCETLYPENMSVFYILGIFTTTATYCLALFMNVVEFNVWCYLLGGSDKSLARPTSRCRRRELIVSLGTGVCSCAKLQVFSSYRGWKEVCWINSEFGHCSLFPSWSGQGLISTPSYITRNSHVWSSEK